MKDDLNTMTTKQIDAALSAEIARLDKAETNLADVRHQLELITGGSDSEAVRKARAKEFEPTLTKAEQSLLNATGVFIDNIDQINEQVGASGGPSLTADEMRDADSRKTFVREDVDELPLSTLVDRFRFALTTDSKPLQFLYARYVPRRLSDTNGSWANSGSDADRQTLQQMLREIDGRLTDSMAMKPIRDKVTALRSRAFKLERDARKRQLAAESYGFQSEREVAW